MSGFDLEVEIRDLAARRDITEAVHNYMRAQDRLLPDLHRSAFHESGYVDCGVFKGSTHAFVDFAQQFLGDVKGSQHLIGQIQIHFDGDEAADGEVYFIAWHRIVEDSEDKDLFIAGRYVDRYEKRDGSWRIAKRHELIDWARTDPVTDSFMKIPGLLQGARGAADFSVTRNWAA
jgi:hypothetical protein